MVCIVKGRYTAKIEADFILGDSDENVFNIDELKERFIKMINEEISYMLKDDLDAVKISISDEDADIWEESGFGSNRILNELQTPYANRS